MNNPSFQISIRARPLLQSLEDEEAWSIDTEKHTVSSIYRPPNQFLQDPSSNENINYIKRRYADVNYNYIFKFDHVFDFKNTTEAVYKQRCRDIVYSFMSGSHGTIFTYGQTMSGKTFTMLGAINNPGVLPFAILDIFEDIEKKRRNNWQIKVTLSYFEIYNETLKDLLCPQTTNLKILDDPRNGVTIQNLKCCEVRSFEEAIMVLKIGEEERNYAQTSFHDRSSRSHTVFQVRLEQTNQNQEKPLSSILNLIDLAGSERVGEDDVRHNQSEETGFINKSLFVLSNVIHRLAEGKKNTFIPYRDSKLTRILAHSLGGGTPTAIICTISPANMNFYQTLSTLRFADRAKSVQRNILFSVDKNVLQNNSGNKSMDRGMDGVAHYELLIENLRRQIEIKDKEIKTLKTTKKNGKTPKKNKKMFEISMEFVHSLKNVVLGQNDKIDEFFEEIEESTRIFLENPKNNEELRAWSVRFQEFYSNYKKSQQNQFEIFKKLPFKSRLESPAEKIFEKLENESLFTEILNSNTENPITIKKNLEEEYEKLWNFFEDYFRKILQNPNLKDNEFISVGQITENHKQTLYQLESLYKKALFELVDKSKRKEKTPKFCSEQVLSSFSFPTNGLKNKS